jgi:hypothetical protein
LRRQEVPFGNGELFVFNCGGRKDLDVGNATSRRGYTKDEETPFPQGIPNVEDSLREWRMSFVYQAAAEKL